MLRGLKRIVIFEQFLNVHFVTEYVYLLGYVTCNYMYGEVNYYFCYTVMVKFVNIRVNFIHRVWPSGMQDVLVH